MLDTRELAQVPADAGSPEPAAAAAAAPRMGDFKFCMECGAKIPGSAKFCPELFAGL